MLVDLARIPLPWALGAEVAAWVLLGAGFVVLAGIRWWKRILFGIAIGVGLLLTDSFVQKIPERTLALMIITMSGSLWATIIFMRGTWRSCLEAKNGDGSESGEIDKYAARLTFGIVGAVFAFFILFAVIFKGAGI